MTLTDHAIPSRATASITAAISDPIAIFAYSHLCNRIGIALLMMLIFGFRVALADPGEVSISDTHFIRDGQIWTAKGIDLVGRTAPAAVTHGDYMQARQRFGQAEIENIKTLGADVVRFQVSQGGTDPRSPIYSSQYVREIEDAVEIARTAGFSVIVCVDSQRPSGLDEAGMPSEETARSWATLAPIFLRDRGVLYEIFNEPNSSRDRSKDEHPWERWRVMMQFIVNQIRAMGSVNVILLDGLNWGRQLDGAPDIKDEYHQIGYAVHPYYDASIATDSGRDSTFGNFSAHHAVMASEWDASVAEHYGCQLNLPKYAHETVSYLDRKRIGVIFWAFDYPNTIFEGFSEKLTTYDGYACKTANPFGPGALLLEHFKHTP